MRGGDAPGSLRCARDDAPHPPKASDAVEFVPGVDLDVEALLRLRFLAPAVRSGRKASRSSLPGAVRHRRRGRGVELYDIRTWTEGDDIRHLDRNVTARTGTPHVRTFREERERAVTLVADFRSSMLFGTRRAFRSVAGMEALTALGWRALDDGGRAALAAVTDEGLRFFGWARSAQALAAMIGEAAVAHRRARDHARDREAPLSEALEEAARLAGSAAMVLATALDSPGERFDVSAERFARRHDLSVLLVVDRFEREPAPGAYPYRTEEGAGWLHVARVQEAASPDARAARLRRLGIDHLEIDAGLAPEAMLRLLGRFDG